MLGLAQAGQVGVDDGGGGAFVAEVDLDLPEVFALFEQVGEADAMIEGGDGGEDAADLSGGEDDGEFGLGIGADEFQLVGPGAFEGFLPEKLEGADDLGAGLAGDFLFGLEMNAILAEVLGGDQVGGFGEELAELADAGVIGLGGAGRDGEQAEIIGE